jgi:hypothetical protein
MQRRPVGVRGGVSLALNTGLPVSACMTIHTWLTNEPVSQRRRLRPNRIREARHDDGIATRPSLVSPIRALVVLDMVLL